MLTANKRLAVDGSTGRGSNIHKVLYATDVDTYFVARAIEKTLIKEDKVMPNSYSYRYVLQPVNTFGTRIVDEREDADCNEIDFVPATQRKNTATACFFHSQATREQQTAQQQEVPAAFYKTIRRKLTEHSINRFQCSR